MRQGLELGLKLRLVQGGLYRKRVREVVFLTFYPHLRPRSHWLDFSPNLFLHRVPSLDSRPEASPRKLTCESRACFAFSSVLLTASAIAAASSESPLSNDPERETATTARAVSFCARLLLWGI